jgi:isopentenyl diphosphate isomerase/L-lactate dehydrogenase-like FMN-dependent dehydrogenase
MTAASHSTRRAFLRFLAASPLVACLDLPRNPVAALAQEPDLIKTAKDALDVFDFEAVARKTLIPAHLGYLETGTDDDGTLRANREGFERYQLRVRRLVDGSKVDLSARLLGARWETPVLLCPCGSHKAFHPEGELAVARASRSKKHLFVLATPATASIEDVTAARGEPVWFQLYQRNDWNQTRQMIKRAEATGSPVLVYTIDLLGGSNRVTNARVQRNDKTDCRGCHTSGRGRGDSQPMTAGLKPAPPAPEAGPPTWDYVKRLKDATPMKLVLKGIVTREDAEIALQHGVDGIWVSNHGGRAENSGRSTVECVPEVVAGVAGRAPVIVDSGFRRGTDIFKALALGATTIGIGRPYLWGLASFGQEGVEMVLDILRRELQMVMRQAGTTDLTKITRAYVIDRFSAPKT